jgi:prepilin-type N-terminal cleavage/methylation domain-containing protein/prepilin-type processing-associated H-X9-DG protein
MTDGQSERAEHFTLSREDLPMASRRRGFTLVELMVLILISGLLIAFALEVIPRSRINTHRVNCNSNLRNVGLALHGYLDTKGSYPNAGTFREPSTPDPTSKPSIIGGCFTEATGMPFWQPGFAGGGGGGRDAGPLQNWVVDVLPYLDAQDLANAWNRDKWYGSNDADPATGIPSNRTIGNTSIGVLACSEDMTIQPAQGNLSYVVNGGFSRWWYTPTIGWTGRAKGGADNATGVDWGADVAGMTGVMFLAPDDLTRPWHRRTRTADITDGTSQTLLASENVNAGYSKGSPRTAGLETNWACPHPNFVMFIGSDAICPQGRCPTGKAAPTLTASASGRGGDAWRNASDRRAFPYEAINYGHKSIAEGESPFPSSFHKGGVNAVMCDGSVRFLSETIDGTVYSKLITPAGGRLPTPYRQLPLAGEAY